MPELPQKKVGIIACSGEELAEGTVTRLAALKVLEELRPTDTVTICLPLFLAGGEGDRAFAKFYPTIAIDGCEKRCAFRGTEKYSNRPAAGFVVSGLVNEEGLESPCGLRKLNQAGIDLANLLAEKIANQVDELLDKNWSRRQGQFSEPLDQPDETETKQATCACGSGIPVQTLQVNGQALTIIALPLIFQNVHLTHPEASQEAIQKILEMVKIYNGISADLMDDLQIALKNSYQEYCHNQEQHK